jgi:hypothetical protein
MLNGTRKFTSRGNIIKLVSEQSAGKSSYFEHGYAAYKTGPCLAYRAVMEFSFSNSPVLNVMISKGIINFRMEWSDLSGATAMPDFVVQDVKFFSETSSSTCHPL